MAVDFGDRRTGLAATDFTGRIVTPLQNVVALSDEDCVVAIAELVAERETQLVVVGLPLDSSGEIGPRAKRTMSFVALLARRLTCPVLTCDERHSTDDAHELLRQSGMKAAQRKKLADSVAAVVILRRFLDQGR